MSLLSKFPAKMARSIGEALRDRRGMSAVEFCLIFPVLMLAYIGAVETGNLLTIYRRTYQIATTAADLTAQTKSVSTSDLGDIVAASSSILTPYSTTPLKVVISSVVADNNNNGKVAWSYASKGSGRATNSAYNVPTGLTDPGSSVIVSEITYGFTPLVDMPQFFSPGSFDIKRTFYERPRKSLTVSKTN